MLKHNCHNPLYMYFSLIFKDLILRKDIYEYSYTHLQSGERVLYFFIFSSNF